MQNFVIFGASGDLAKNYIFPALAKLFSEGLEFDYYGYGRSQFDTSDIQKCLKNFTYITGNYDTSGLSSLKPVLKNQDSIFYLAIPTSPELVSSIAHGLVKNNLLSSASVVVIEKPFGYHTASAKQLMSCIKKTIGFSRVFLVDHYLTKELVKNIVSLRFANPILEHLWHRRFIDRIEIIATETRGIDNRGSYYDQVGALRDMVQNHCLQLVTLITMDQPQIIDPIKFSQAKKKILQKISLYYSDYHQSVKLGQYHGYLDEKDVVPDSTTETYVELTLKINTPRWKNTPIKIITGKKLDQKTTQIIVYFKKELDCLWGERCALLPQNKLTINIFPQNEISLTLNSEFNPSKNLPSAVNLRLGYSDEEQQFHTAYENIIVDIAGDIHINSPSYQEILWQWKIIDSIRNHPEFGKKISVY